MGNSFRGTKTALDVRATTDVEVGMNTFRDVGARLAADVPLDLDARPIGDVVWEFVPSAKRPDAIDPMIADERLRGRHRIIVDEWGPYDWKSPKLWPAGKPDERPLKLRVLGPDGTWSLARARGATVGPRRGPSARRDRRDADSLRGPSTSTSRSSTAAPRSSRPAVRERRRVNPIASAIRASSCRSTGPSASSRTPRRPIP
jgi:hypothetical protein